MLARHAARILPAVLLFLTVSLGVYGQSSQSLTIYAASSLTDAFEQLAAAFGKRHPQVETVINFANSSTLAAQLIAGAPADIFASAAETQMALVTSQQRIAAEAVTIFARNQLILILPADNPADIHTLQDLANPEVLLALAVEGTPIRTYTDAMLAALEDQYGADFSQRVIRNLVSEESNVRQVVARVALGEADAAIVYQTDAVGRISQDLIIIPIDPAFNQIASYPIAALADSPRLALAEGFIEFVLSTEGQRILRANGFCSPVIIDDQMLTQAPPSEADDEPQAEIAQCDGPKAQS